MKPQNAAASETEPQKVSKGKDEPMVCLSNSDPKTPMKAKDDNASKAKDVNLEEKNKKQKMKPVGNSVAESSESGKAAEVHHESQRVGKKVSGKEEKAEHRLKSKEHEVDEVDGVTADGWTVVKGKDMNVKHISRDDFVPMTTIKLSASSHTESERHLLADLLLDDDQPESEPGSPFSPRDDIEGVAKDEFDSTGPGPVQPPKSTAGKAEESAAKQLAMVAGRLAKSGKEQRDKKVRATESDAPKAKAVEAKQAPKEDAAKAPNADAPKAKAAEAEFIKRAQESAKADTAKAETAAAEKAARADAAAAAAQKLLSAPPKGLPPPPPKAKPAEAGKSHLEGSWPKLDAAKAPKADAPKAKAAEADKAKAVSSHYELMQNLGLGLAEASHLEDISKIAKGHSPKSRPAEAKTVHLGEIEKAAEVDAPKAKAVEAQKTTTTDAPKVTQTKTTTTDAPKVIAANIESEDVEAKIAKANVDVIQALKARDAEKVLAQKIAEAQKVAEANAAKAMEAKVPESSKKIQPKAKGPPTRPPPTGGSVPNLFLQSTGVGAFASAYTMPLVSSDGCPRPEQDIPLKKDKLEAYMPVMNQSWNPSMPDQQSVPLPVGLLQQGGGGGGEGGGAAGGGGGGKRADLAHFPKGRAAAPSKPTDPEQYNYDEFAEELDEFNLCFLPPEPDTPLGTSVQGNSFQPDAPPDTSPPRPPLPVNSFRPPPGLSLDADDDEGGETAGYGSGVPSVSPPRPSSPPPGLFQEPNEERKGGIEGMLDIEDALEAVQ
jgi:hypothetical protein